MITDECCSRSVETAIFFFLVSLTTIVDLALGDTPYACGDIGESDGDLFFFFCAFERTSFHSSECLPDELRSASGILSRSCSSSKEKGRQSFALLLSLSQSVVD